MKQYSNTWYTVQRPNGNGGLCTTPESEASIEASRTLIDESNANAVKRGYKSSQYSIVKVESNRWFDKDMFDGGILILSTRTETYVETYPKSI